ncbi:hypothetical protein ASPWEDRAFT_176395 [Aspergillus wentii DTO 134E9]|uniref:Uncharacterized protein n=1 Tax=Aspergillus wentii DTO 134E9 TaxID=1073089 RepID=A0A1L9R8R5_ASPWE|nr:uncharacterized protein ASPWEDRAFT_176395 [Aspergillus wentii DTO 134E9]KAI9925126.1 hypothetical protein MW887_006534 [Aspergillus wentii]OJJ31312.1 hypothetical protein ASPWEDRAFT_176395 [Aspergillus wentii DTO 134E9]
MTAPWLDAVFSVPVRMALVLVVAVAFAAGHHAFYQSLNGQTVSDSQSAVTRKLPLRVSDQQFNVSVGTFFAFLVKALLSVAVSDVFNQFAWRKLMRGPPTRIAVIDNLFDTLQNGFVLINFGLWRKHPSSMALATVFWLLPISSMITPATLNVKMAPSYNSTTARVPQIDFSSSNFVTMTPFLLAGLDLKIQDDQYVAATPEVQRLVTSTAMEGAILPIQPPSPNSAWKLQFHGPALRCDPVNQTLSTAIVHDVERNIKNSTSGDPGLVTGMAYGFISWVPHDNSTNGSTPFYQLPSTGDPISSSTPRNDYLGPLQEFRSFQVGDAEFGAGWSPLSVFLATFPHMLEEDSGDLGDMWRTARDPTITQCSLFNTSYTVEFNYTNGEQTVNISDYQYLNSVSHIHDVQSNQEHLPDLQSATGAAASIYQTALEMFAYQAVMEQFCRLMVGWISEAPSIENYTVKGDPKHQWNGYSLDIKNTSIMSTALSNAAELGTIKTAMSKVGAADGFQNMWNEHSVTHANQKVTGSLATAVEEMFRNITISLMNSDLLQPNYTMPSAPPNVNVTLESHRNIYTYSVSILWTSYGIAIAVTLVSVVFGVIAHFSNNGSYTTSLSTFLRTTQAATISTQFRPEDCSGKYPRPGYIGNATIAFGEMPPEQIAMVDGAKGTASSPLIEEMPRRSGEVSPVSSRPSSRMGSRPVSGFIFRSSIDGHR